MVKHYRNGNLMCMILPLTVNVLCPGHHTLIHNALTLKTAHIFVGPIYKYVLLVASIVVLSLSC